MNSPETGAAGDSQYLNFVLEENEIVGEFVNESRENLDQFARELSELGRDSTARGLLSSMFRTLHTVKGTSGFLSFSRIENLAHAGESLLAGFRQQVFPGPATCAALHEIVERIRNILDTISATGNEGAGDDAELLTRFGRLEQFDRTAASGCPRADSLAVAGTPRGTEHDDSAKPIGQLLVEREGVSPAAVQAARDLQRRGDLRTIGEILVSQGVVTPVAARDIVEYQQEARAASICESSVRVEVALLDRIVDLTEEVMQSCKDVARLAGNAHDPELGAVSEHLLNVVTRLHGEAMKTQVQRLATLEGMLFRLVRDLSRISGKQVRLEMKGSEIEMDRSVLSNIRDPLMHLVRNAVDHGIEFPQDRLAAGKPSEGCICLSANCSNGDVIIEVSDDGAGIDLDRVKREAMVQGLITPNRADGISEAEIIGLVFRPGFTTARVVSHISGRGVGMDVVKSKVERIGGKVDLLTRKSSGTTVRLTVPLGRTSFVRKQSVAS